MTTALSKNEGQALAQPATTWMTPSNLEQGLELAKMIADSGLVPDHLARKPGACLMIMAQASKWGMDALSVAQCTSMDRGRLQYEGKLVHAALVSMGAIKPGSEVFDFFGQPGSNDRGIKLTVTMANGQTHSITGTVGQWRTYGKKKDGTSFKNAWDKQPDDQLIYRAWRQFSRRHAPAAMLGVHTPEEALPEQETEVRVINDPAIAASFLKNVQNAGMDGFLQDEERQRLDDMSYSEIQELYSELVRRKKAANEGAKQAEPKPQADAKKPKSEPVDAKVKAAEPEPKPEPQPEPESEPERAQPEPPPEADTEGAFD